MRCSICKRNNAIINIREYSNNGFRMINLCFECAFKNILNVTTQIKRVGNDRTTTLVCPNCHKTLEDFNGNLKAGCPTCYFIFEQIIDLIIYKQNNSLNYLGKLPDELIAINKYKKKLNKLKRELKQHVDIEEYNKAAIIRDEIKKLKKEIKKGMKQIATK